MTSNDFDIESFRLRLAEIIGSESKRSFASRCNLSDAAILKYLGGQSVPSIDRAMSIAKAGGVNLLWLAAGEGPKLLNTVDAPAANLGDQDVVWIDSFDVLASAGNGAHNEWEHLEARIPFAKDWLRAHDLDGKKLAALKVHGDSMYSTLDHGDTVLVELLPDDAAEQLVDGVYVLRLNGNLLIKRLQSDLMGGLYIKSDNSAYREIHISQQSKPEDIRIIARWTEKKI